MNEAKILRQLLRGDVICTATNLPAVEWLRTELGQEYVKEALIPFGFKLSFSEDEMYFFSSYADLDDSQDAKALKPHLQNIVNSMTPVLSFMEFVSKANGEDSYPDIEHILRFSELLITVENNEQVKEALKSLTSSTFFKNARSKKTSKDQLSTILDILADHGLLASDGGGSQYTVTGKFAYYIEIYESVVGLHSPDILDESIASQQEEIGF
jgi:hypothetical protein